MDLGNVCAYAWHCTGKFFDNLCSESRWRSYKGKILRIHIQLVMGSVKPTTEMRNQVFVASKIKQKIAIMLDRPVPQPELHQNDGPTLGATRKRCTMCQKAATGKGYSKKKKDSIPYVKTLCQSCGNATCREHMLQKCTVLRLRFHVLRLLLDAWLKNFSCFWNFFAGTAIWKVFFHRFGLNQSLGK